MDGGTKKYNNNYTWGSTVFRTKIVCKAICLHISTYSYEYKGYIAYLSI